MLNNYCNLKKLGLTLIETLIGLFLVSLIAFFSLSYVSVYKKDQLSIVCEEIKNAVHLARMQALSTGKKLVLTTIPETSNWAEGMVLYLDTPQHQYDTSSKPIYAWRWKSSGIDVSWHGLQSNDYLIFAAELKSNITNGYFLIKNSTQEIKLIVNRLGRVRKI